MDEAAGCDRSARPGLRISGGRFGLLGFGSGRRRGGRTRPSHLEVDPCRPPIPADDRRPRAAARAGRLPRTRHDGRGDGREPGPSRASTVTAWNRTPGRAPELADLGVAMADTPAQAVAEADIAVLCVSDTPDVEAVLFGPDGVAEGARPGTLIVDCSTIAPSGSWDFAARLGERGLAMVDAPVSGGSEGARNGDADDLRRWRCGGRRACPSGPDRDGPDDHPRRTDRRRPGGQGRQPGHPRRRLPRGRGRDRPRDQGRPRCRAGRRGSRRRRGPELGPRQPCRPDDRQRVPARLQGGPPPQGPRRSPSTWLPSSAPSSPSARSWPSSRPA